MSRRALAAAIGIAPASLARIEDGLLQRPKPHTLEGLVRELRLSERDINGADAGPVGAAPSPFGKLTVEEEDALLNYLRFLRWSREHRSRTNGL